MLVEIVEPALWSCNIFTMGVLTLSYTGFARCRDIRYRDVTCVSNSSGPR